MKTCDGTQDLLKGDANRPTLSVSTRNLVNRFQLNFTQMKESYEGTTVKNLR